MFKSCKKATSILLSSYEETALISGISDIIIVKWPNNQYKCTPFIVCFGSISQLSKGMTPTLKINNRVVKFLEDNNSNKDQSKNKFSINKYGYIQPFHPSKEIINSMNLKPGKNKMQWILPQYRNKQSQNRQHSAKGIKYCKILTAQIYFFNIYDRIVISDFDGTLTKTDIKGIYNNFMGRNYLHDGYDVLIRKIVEHGHRIVWITMRSISMYKMSKKYITQYIGCQGVLLPEPQQFFPSLKKQILKKTCNIKTNMLKSIRNLFPPDINPFAGGLGNRENDAIAYLAVQIPNQRIYLIDQNSDVHRMGEMRVLNYQQILEEVDKHFPVTFKRKQMIRIYSRESSPIQKVLKSQTTNSSKIVWIKKKLSLTGSRKIVEEENYNQRIIPRPFTKIPQLQRNSYFEQEIEETESRKFTFSRHKLSDNQ